MLTNNVIKNSLRRFLILEITDSTQIEIISVVNKIKSIDITTIK